ncbi:MAG TPA: hypothetical protein VLN59_17330, partial [Burkholderiales bacterium]|nr:hypothetical protein [Burkholderiales bacterium]
YIVGLDALTRANGMPTPRTLYRWHRKFGERLIYYPAVAYSSFGLVHWHLIIEEPRGRWDEWPYSIRADWIVRRPGQRHLYLHCLIPRIHEDVVRELLDDLVSLGFAKNTTILTSEDGAQYLCGMLHTKTTSSAESAVVWRDALSGIHDLIERYPLVLPVTFEMTEQRRSIPRLWDVIYDRLGERVWEYLPPRITRMPHNGKIYVREALRLLCDAFLVRQHMIRFQPLEEISIDLIAVTAGGPEDALNLVGNEPPLVEIFPSVHETCIVRVSSTLSFLTKFFSAGTMNIMTCFFVDRTMNEREPVSVRFRYEELFDPATAEWVFPRDSIMARLSR